jgi:hypothetical protein
MHKDKKNSIIFQAKQHSKIQGWFVFHSLMSNTMFYKIFIKS